MIRPIRYMGLWFRLGVLWGFAWMVLNGAMAFADMPDWSHWLTLIIFPGALVVHFMASIRSIERERDRRKQLFST